MFFTYFDIFNRQMIILLRKFLYLLCINVLNIEIERQSLVMLLVLSLFLFYEIKRKPYFLKKLNMLSLLSHSILILTIWLKLFAFSMKIYELDIFANSFILILCILFFLIVLTILALIKMKKILSTFNTSIAFFII